VYDEKAAICSSKERERVHMYTTLLCKSQVRRALIKCENIRFKNIVACTAVPVQRLRDGECTTTVSGRRLGKHVRGGMNTHATTE
jgi:hypothetical protein